ARLSFHALSRSVRLLRPSWVRTRHSQCMSSYVLRVLLSEVSTLSRFLDDFRSTSPVLSNTQSTFRPSRPAVFKSCARGFVFGSPMAGASTMSTFPSFARTVSAPRSAARSPSRPRLRLADQDRRVRMARHRAANPDQILLGVDADHAQVLDRHALAAHAAGEALALDDAARIRRSADRAR